MENAFVLELSESKFRDLYVCFCGYAKCEPLHSYGPAMRSNYLIHYIVEGRVSTKQEIGNTNWRQVRDF